MEDDSSLQGYLQVLNLYQKNPFYVSRRYHNDVFSSCSAASDISEQKNLLAQAFEAIASSSGASKYKTGMKLPGLEKVTNESES